MVSASTAVLEGASETAFNAVGAPIKFPLSCPTLKHGADSIAVYDNGKPVAYETLTIAADSVTITSGLSSGRHTLHFLAQDTFGFTIDQTFVIWIGTYSIQVQVLNENAAPALGATVTIKLSDDPRVINTLSTDMNGRLTFTNLPNRSYNLIATTPDNKLATRPATVFDGLVTMRLLGFKPSSGIDNNEFARGTAGWDIGSSPVTIVQHVEVNGPFLQAKASLGTSSALMSAENLVLPNRSSNGNSSGGPNMQPATLSSATAKSQSTGQPDFDLLLSTSGEGQQSISRTFDVEAGVKSVAVRYRFITSEVPGGYFGSEFNDFYNVSIRTANGGGSVTDGNSMNGMGLSSFDGSGATGWYETEIPVALGGDTVQIDIAVANVADGYLNSMVVIDGVKKKKLTVSQLSLKDIDNTPLTFLSASNHNYFGGQTRVHGTLTIKGPNQDSLKQITLEVLEGGVVATGVLAPALASTIYRPFGDAEEIKIDVSQLLFEISAADLAAVSQNANGNLQLRVRAKSSSGETAEKDFGSVTKLVRYAGGNRYGGRDEAYGGDDWAKPTVTSFIAGAGQSWGDFSNMNGGPFPLHASHRNGNSADGWFDGYNLRNAATAATIIGHLNTHGTRITAVYVTFAPNSAFATAIAGVTLADGRTAAQVIRNHGGHTTHFHWEVSDN